MTTAHAHTYELVVAADGSIPASELTRIGMRPGAHLRVVPDPPVYTSIEGLLSEISDVTWGDFERASATTVSDLGQHA